MRIKLPREIIIFYLEFLENEVIINYANQLCVLSNLLHLYQFAAVIGTGICTTTFAGFLGITNLYLVGQFKILQRHFECSIYEMNTVDKNDSTSTATLNYMNIRDCIKKHQLLLQYLERVENLFSMIILIQTIGSVFLLSFCGFQLILVIAGILQKKIHHEFQFKLICLHYIIG